METILFIIALVLSIGTFVPETGNDFWLIRGQDYFKSFYAVTHLAVLVLLFFVEEPTWRTYLSVVMVSVSFVYCLVTIFPFFSISKATIAKREKKSTESNLSIYISNVYQHNTEFDRTLEKIKEYDPDLIFLLETNQAWADAMEPLKATYPHVLEEIRNDTYGLILLSKFPFDQAEVLHRVKPSIPSVEVSFKMGDTPVTLYGLHPKPPIPGEALTATKKDRELLRTALAIEASTLDHHIVIGDMNDVAWSSVTRKFKRLTGLKDPRQGRGFYPTFPTWSPFRIPLDHVFCSPSFELDEFKLAESVGSDHFPVFVKFHLPEDK
ncbi:endonuclease/exonuclease/phosphatase family protein [Jiulongibacter sp. NS-SX5]|uniref:endonuclease/exonuclease/phosphatase family protein n=1 Tax=Jiulongibacter sp. NS-SX5 TaxID=3463854 RepID=UPI004058BB48